MHVDTSTHATLAESHCSLDKHYLKPGRHADFMHITLLIPQGQDWVDLKYLLISILSR